MRIAFVIPSLGPGGAERVATLLCNEWVRQGHILALASFDVEDPFFPLDEGIDIHAITASTSSGLTARLRANVSRISDLRSWLRRFRPNAAVSFMTEANVAAAWACRGLGVPLVISERNQPERPGLGALRKIARRRSYPLASAMVVQTDEIASWAKARFRIPIQVIPNPVQIGPDQPRRRGDAKLIMSIGRLTPQKGFDVLVKSFAGVAGKHPDCRLVIYGEGPDRPLLEGLRSESGLGGRVSLPGLTKDSARALRQADLFVLPSRFEGYPNALLEALASERPVVATACPGATAEILANGVYGMLVPPDDVAALTNALDSMLSAPELRDAYASKARRAVAELDVATIGRRWLDVLAGLKG